MNNSSDIFNQPIDMDQDRSFAPPILRNFSNGNSDGSESCFSGKVKLPDPIKFDGTPKDFKAFASSIQLYFWAKSDVFTNDRDKIIYLGSHLLGPAMVWFTTIIMDNDPCLNTYDGFFTQFRRNFSDPNIAINARGMLRRYRQGTKTVAAYATEFRVLGRDSGYDQLVLVDQFLRGLNDNIMAYLMVEEISDRLEGCIDAAMLIDHRLSNRDVFLSERPT
ncbi:Retrotransposon-derived protein PEG10 [Smittium culicis]|uniref:Retrotransposon-derived protein PEG10 n=1 Tax=Smittium culicis TaxID=133412 RepID=A0A1R1X487_9FUNG|nr:Retrotransposon-derived protein PEG10 [Smittium culicis]